MMNYKNIALIVIIGVHVLVLQGMNGLSEEDVAKLLTTQRVSSEDLQKLQERYSCDDAVDIGPGQRFKRRDSQMSSGFAQHVGNAVANVVVRPKPIGPARSTVVSARPHMSQRPPYQSSCNVSALVNSWLPPRSQPKQPTRSTSVNKSSSSDDFLKNFMKRAQAELFDEHGNPVINLAACNSDGYLGDYSDDSDQDMQDAWGRTFVNDSANAQGQQEPQEAADQVWVLDYKEGRGPRAQACSGRDNDEEQQPVSMSAYGSLKGRSLDARSGRSGSRSRDARESHSSSRRRSSNSGDRKGPVVAKQARQKQMGPDIAQWKPGLFSVRPFNKKN